VKEPSLILALLCLSACASQSAEEQLCRASLTADLLNPETARFLDFSRVTEEAFRGDETMSFMRRLMTGPGTGLVPAEGATFYSLRLRAEGELGNVITSRQLCAVPASRSICQCVEMPS
jgi:hypothetical protein